MSKEPSSCILQADEKSMRLERDYTDDDLLRELRRRGRLARIEAESTVPGRIVEAGCSVEHQTKDTCRALGGELAKFITSGRTMPGYQVTEVSPEWSCVPPDRKQRIVLIFVVDPTPPPIP